MKRSCLFHLSGNRFSPLPADHHTRRIWTELAKGFDEYHVLARGNGMRFSHSVDGNVHLHLLPSFGRRMWVFLFLSGLLPYYVIRYRATHLLAQCPVVGGLVAAICSLVFRIPLFVELHGGHYFGSTGSGVAKRAQFLFYRSLARFAFRVAGRVRTLSDDMTGHLCRVYGESLRAKVVVIPTRVDMSVFRKAKKVYERGAVLRIISVGSFIALKNHIALIRDLRATGVAFRLTLVGTGPLQNEYDRVIEELGCRDDVVFAGTVTHEILASLLREHDLYVHYSRSEGLSRAILEAMAVGLPVVATRVGFIGGVLNDAQNCLVIDPPWSSSLAEALKRLASSEPLRRQLGENARNTIEARFESNAVFDVYRKAVLGAARAIRVMT